MPIIHNFEKRQENRKKRKKEQHCVLNFIHLVSQQSITKTNAHMVSYFLGILFVPKSHVFLFEFCIYLNHEDMIFFIHSETILGYKKNY